MVFNNLNRLETEKMENASKICKSTSMVPQVLSSMKSLSFHMTIISCCTSTNMNEYRESLSRKDLMNWQHLLSKSGIDENFADETLLS